GASWNDVAAGLPRAPVTSVLVIPDGGETVHVVVAAGLWSTGDGGGSWVTHDTGSDGVDAIGSDAGDAARLWAARRHRFWRSADRGANWRASAELPDPTASVRAISAMGDIIVVTSDRGLFRSTDGGRRWVALVDNLPAHLEAGPLVRDPSETERLYTGFAVTPYAELWRRGGD